MTLTKSLSFLADLSRNNHKEWMDEHRSRYQEARQEFIQFVDELILGMQAFEPGVSGLKAKDCIFRINRDIRFSKDKSPYKTNFGASISEGGRHSENPSFYVHLQPGDCFVGGGIYMPPAEILKKIRQEVDYNPEELKKIVEDSEFRETFGAIRGEKLKTAPKGYPKDHPNIEFLRLKSFVVMDTVSDQDFKKENAAERVLDYFKVLKPFNDYLAVAVS